ncbi:Uncharacterized protein APZ42_033193 [Daphnia magna]|uniref:Uncharacterized protein n=1 Tax=Daphnia magna TaxID=35525 RepID=A0A164LBE1_9CRUS|nr:Uncharacterized protein APZ42_033193 [Daphnia magna]
MSKTGFLEQPIIESDALVFQYCVLRKLKIKLGSDLPACFGFNFDSKENHAVFLHHTLFPGT